MYLVQVIFYTTVHVSSRCIAAVKMADSYLLIKRTPSLGTKAYLYSYGTRV